MLVYFVIAAVSLPSLTLIAILFIYGSKLLKVWNNIRDGISASNNNFAMMYQENRLEHKSFDVAMKDNKEEHTRIWSEVKGHGEKIARLTDITTELKNKVG
jgi:hypothetical protein